MFQNQISYYNASENMSDLYKPSAIPLIVILIGNCVLAIPSAYGTFLLIMGLLNGSTEPFKHSTTVNIFIASLIGFALLFGYVAIAITQKHNTIFWICSAIFNLYLSYNYVYTAVNNLSIIDGSPMSGQRPIPVLLLIWTLIVTGCSAYYVFHAWQLKQVESTLQ